MRHHQYGFATQRAKCCNGFCPPRCPPRCSPRCPPRRPKCCCSPCCPPQPDPPTPGPDNPLAGRALCSSLVTPADEYVWSKGFAESGVADILEKPSSTAYQVISIAQKKDEENEAAIAQITMYELKVINACTGAAVTSPFNADMEDPDAVFIQYSSDDLYWILVGKKIGNNLKANLYRYESGVITELVTEKEIISGITEARITGFIADKSQGVDNFFLTANILKGTDSQAELVRFNENDVAMKSVLALNVFKNSQASLRLIMDDLFYVVVKDYIPDTGCLPTFTPTPGNIAGPNPDTYVAIVRVSNIYQSPSPISEQCIQFPVYTSLGQPGVEAYPSFVGSTMVDFEHRAKRYMVIGAYGQESPLSNGIAIQNYPVIAQAIYQVTESDFSLIPSGMSQNPLSNADIFLQDRISSNNVLIGNITELKLQWNDERKHVIMATRSVRISGPKGANPLAYPRAVVYENAVIAPDSGPPYIQYQPIYWGVQSFITPLVIGGAVNGNDYTYPLDLTKIQGSGIDITPKGSLVWADKKKSIIGPFNERYGGVYVVGTGCMASSSESWCGSSSTCEEVCMTPNTEISQWWAKPMVGNFEVRKKPETAVTQMVDTASSRNTNYVATLTEGQIIVQDISSAATISQIVLDKSYRPYNVRMEYHDSFLYVLVNYMEGSEYYIELWRVNESGSSKSKLKSLKLTGKDVLNFQVYNDNSVVTFGITVSTTTPLSTVKYSTFTSSSTALVERFSVDNVYVLQQTGLSVLAKDKVYFTYVSGDPAIVEPPVDATLSTNGTPNDCYILFHNNVTTLTQKINFPEPDPCYTQPAQSCWRGIDMVYGELEDKTVKSIMVVASGVKNCDRSPVLGYAMYTVSDTDGGAPMIMAVTRGGLNKQTNPSTKPRVLEFRRAYNIGLITQISLSFDGLYSSFNLAFRFQSQNQRTDGTGYCVDTQRGGPMTYCPQPNLFAFVQVIPTVAKIYSGDGLKMNKGNAPRGLNQFTIVGQIDSNENASATSLGLSLTDDGKHFAFASSAAIKFAPFNGSYSGVYRWIVHPQDT